MPFDVRRFQFMLGTPCECENITYTDESGAHVAITRCCVRCWEVGLMSLQAMHHAELTQRNYELQLEMDVVVEPAAPPPA
jgi:hypothetical protein